MTITKLNISKRLTITPENKNEILELAKDTNSLTSLLRKMSYAEKEIKHHLSSLKVFLVAHGISEPWLLKAKKRKAKTQRLEASPELVISMARKASSIKELTTLLCGNPNSRKNILECKAALSGAGLNEWISKRSRFTDEEIFAEESRCPRSAAKSRIIENNLIAYQCRKCGNTGIWNGSTVVLALEHKNGKANDHRLENLEFLCPNCHSQTPTFARRKS